MSVPSELRRLIETALEAVQSHPRRDLSLGYREAIWAAFGPPKYSPHPAEDDSGYRRRVYLATITARQVLPLWERSFPDNDLPHRILAKAERVAGRVVDDEAALKDIEDAWDYVESIAADTDDMAVAALCSAIQALGAARRDEIFDPDNIDLDKEGTTDPMYGDAASLAAEAYASALGSDCEIEDYYTRRKEFWEWWLQEAVPKAWEMDT